MVKPGEWKSVQNRILKYAQEIGWVYVSRKDAETRRNFNQECVKPADKAKNASLYFSELLYSNLREFNPKLNESYDEFFRRFELLKSDINGNYSFLQYLREEEKFFYKDENRELNLKVIDYDDPANNVYEVTEEYYFHNGKYGIREDIVFLINGIPILVIECKNSTVDEAIALGVDQIRRYHDEAPEAFVPQMIFSVTESIGFSYGVTWNTIRRNIFNWKDEQIGNLENKVKTFCNIDNILGYLKEFIIFAEKDEELHKYILRQHQTEAVTKVVERAQNEKKKRGLIWHTQGSGKTFTMLKAAQILFKAPVAEKPTILLLIDRNELQDQTMRNLASLGISNVQRAENIDGLNKLLKDDFRGIIVTMIHKFRGMKEKINERNNIYVLVDEAHRTTGGDLGTFLMAAIPNASIIGFTGTPIDKTVFGKGTFKTFGIDDDSGYLHKYSIAESIKDGTTLPLFYSIAPNEMVVPDELLDSEFLSLKDAYGVTDIEELNKVLERAVNLRNFLKGKARIEKVAKFIANHYVENVEPLGYKAFIVGVDREACALYKKAIDEHLPKKYSEVVYTGNNNDKPLLKEFHLEQKAEKQIRKSFTKLGEYPKILIVTEKLLTGFDAPILYAMYLDKPMRDHTLLQAIARVNRPYENEEQDMLKPHGFVLDFVGIFDKLEKALEFDSDEIDSVIKDLNLLKNLFSERMKDKGIGYLALIQNEFNDKDTDNIIEHFKDKEKRKEFIKFYKEIEMLYEIISPDAFLRPYIDDYSSLSSMYLIVRNAFQKKIYVDKEFQRKTNELVQDKIESTYVTFTNEFIEINEQTIEKIKEDAKEDNTRVINLIKRIIKEAEENSNDPMFITMQIRALLIQHAWENRQLSTHDALVELLKELEEHIERKKLQAQKGFDNYTFYVYERLKDKNIPDVDVIINIIRDAFAEFHNWQTSESDLRELRKKITFAVLSKVDSTLEVTELVEEIFQVLLSNN